MFFSIRIRIFIIYNIEVFCLFNILICITERTICFKSIFIICIFWKSPIYYTRLSSSKFFIYVYKKLCYYFFYNSSDKIDKIFSFWLATILFTILLEDKFHLFLISPSGNLAISLLVITTILVFAHIFLIFLAVLR